MKKIVFVIASGLLAFPVFGQWNNNGDNYTTGSLNVYETIRSGGDYQLGQDGPSYSYGEGRRFIFSGTGWSYDPMWISKFAVDAQVSELRAYLSADTNDKFVIGHCTDITTGGMSKLMVVGNNVGIGTDDPYYKLDVNGTLRAKEVKVNLNSGADFVFAPGYQLKPLDEVQSFIKENKHLPEIPTAAEMTNGDTDLGTLQVKLLQKIEELTLYVIQQNGEIQKQNDEIQALKTKLTEMETAK